MGHKINVPIQLGISDFHLLILSNASTVCVSNEKREMDVRILGSFSPKKYLKCSHHLMSLMSGNKLRSH